MKQELYCEACAAPVLELRRYPGEYIRVAQGELGFDCRCDGCASDLAAGALVSAVSFWTDDVPFLDWEGGYLRSVLLVRRDDSKAEARA